MAAKKGFTVVLCGVLVVLFFMPCGVFAKECKLWYSQPAGEWTEALPVGNGRLGAMVFGGIELERLQLNEDTVWSGKEVSVDMAGAYKYLDKARELLFSEEYSEAERLVQRRFVGLRNTHCYQTLGELCLEFKVPGRAKDYRRELDLTDATASVRYKAGDAVFTREVFSSAVDQVIVVRLTCDRPGKLDFKITLSRPEFATITAVGNHRLIMHGQADRGGENEGVRFEAQLMVKAEGGQVTGTESGITVSKANAVTLLLAAATDYRGDEPSEICSRQLNAAAKKSYQALRRAHVADYQKLFGRVQFVLGGEDKSALPTDKRLEAVRQGGQDLGLTALYFQYGRYLLISSSRPGCMPANLQGLWNEHLSPPFFCGYHLNINHQIIYWPVEVVNLAECHEPLFDLTDNVRRSGSRTARDMYDCRGFVAHHRTNAWWFTGVSGYCSYAMWPMGGGTLARHLWEHYQFTCDMDFLRSRAYPVMKDAALFYLDWLVESPRTGKLVSGPSVSPENHFRLDNGQVAFLSMGPSMDQEIIWETFTNCIKAADVLGIDDEFVESVREALKRLAVPQIGDDGRLLEWAEEKEEVELGHRHISHLYGLYPSHQFTLRGTPDLAQACRKSLECRIKHAQTITEGEEATAQLGNSSWSLAWVINWWARLEDGQKAYKAMRDLLCRCTFPNLFSNHLGQVDFQKGLPGQIFQIDGNCGATAGIAEMLLQSHTGEILLLPALPKEWGTGYVKGLRARGGFEVDIYWQGGTLTKATVRSKLGGKCCVRYGQKSTEFGTKAGKSYDLDANLMLVK